MGEVTSFMVQQTETQQMETQLGPIQTIHQTKKILEQNMPVPDVDEAIFTKQHWSDTRDTSAESQLHTPAQCVEGNSRDGMS